MPLLCRSREIHRCRRGEDSRAPMIALVLVFVGAAHHRVDEVMGVTFWGPAHWCRAGGSCPQGHGPIIRCICDDISPETCH